MVCVNARLTSSNTAVTGETHCLIAFQCTAKGLAHFMKLNAEYSHGYKSTLTKDSFINDE